ncbi:hypothetical protein F7725_002545 [Dissostichus mawsoni]|uniref:Phosphodiesterase n=1 Tax=Dissostichus mawsoni TaxID=36200 RepID=A0A7J5Y2N3_DISMA|nr:hypothetical protein F7725_002545 [Dissostichus mawsoni]
MGGNDFLWTHFVTRYLHRDETENSVKLKGVLEQMDRGVVDLQELRRNLELAAAMLDSVYTDETNEVRDWLACTFTRKMGVAKRRPEEKPRFRSIVHADVQTDLQHGRSHLPPAALTALKATGDHALKFLVYDLLNRYDLINRFRVNTPSSANTGEMHIPVQALVQFVEALESGYSKHRNPYHNLTHAADVTQTAHCLMLHTGLMHWLSELEILAMVFAAAIHDFEHTGTTNNFHIHTRSEVAILYNDRSILENHHVSAAYRLMAEDDMNILVNLNKDDWRELRALVIEMVMSTDMSLDKVKGDKEVELGLPFSPLCDRKATMIAQSQIGKKINNTIGCQCVVTRSDRHDGESDRSSDRRGQEGKRDGDTEVESHRKGSVTVEAVQRHSSNRHGNSDDGQLDFSLTAIDLPAMKQNLSDVIGSNKDRWKELSVHELASKEKADKEEEQSNVNSDVQSNASPSHSVPDGQTTDQSQEGSPPDEERQDDTPPVHLTYNGAGLAEEKEDEEEVPEKA